MDATVTWNTRPSRWGRRQQQMTKPTATKSAIQVARGQCAGPSVLTEPRMHCRRLPCAPSCPCLHLLRVAAPGLAYAYDQTLS